MWESLASTNMRCISGVFMLFYSLFQWAWRVWKWSQYSSVFCIMPHLRLIILHTPIWGQSWILNCILRDYFRFILKGISEQIHPVVEMRQGRKKLAQMGDFWPFTHPVTEQSELLVRDKSSSNVGGDVSCQSMMGLLSVLVRWLSNQSQTANQCCIK